MALRDPFAADEAGMPAYVPPPTTMLPASPPRRAVFGLRPADRGDRGRVEEICDSSFAGEDPLPRQFDSWIDAEEGEFLVAEVEGRLAAMHRVVPAGGGILWYEGLRVAPEFRGHGLGRRMVEMATVAGARRGYTEIRLHAGPDCAGFFRGSGFSANVDVARWDADPSRTGGLPAVLDARHADLALGWLRQDMAFRLYPGLHPVFGRSHEDDRGNVLQLARRGSLRFAGTVPAFAAVHPGEAEEPLRVTFLAGAGDGLAELLHGLRHAAHVEGRPRARVLGPLEHPCRSELEAAGFAVRDAFRLTVFSRPLCAAASASN